MTPHKFEIELKLIDGRKLDAFHAGKPFHYRVVMKSGLKECSFWSERLDEKEVGTLRSFKNVTDNINWRILKELCPKEAAIKHEKHKKLLEKQNHNIGTTHS